MPSVTIEAVLLESDVPDLLLARDAVGTAYVCLLVRRDDLGDHFVAVPVSPQRLADFKAGVVELRVLLSEPETQFSFSGRFQRVAGRPAINLQLIDAIPEDSLPEEGFWLTAFTGPTDNSHVVRHANERHAAVINCHFRPPESGGQTLRIDAEHLADGLSVVQTLIKHAYKKQLVGMAAARKLQLGVDGHVIQAVGVSLQSFCVHFESKYPADLVGESALGLAMARVDQLMSVVEGPEAARLEILSQNRGHIISAFRRLMEFVRSANAPLEYQWAEPAMQHARSRHVTPFTAAAVCAVLDARQDLAVEEVRFSGQFIRVSIDRGTWLVKDSEGRYRRGVRHEDAQNVLTGAIMENRRFDLVCEERLQLTADGRQIPKLFLKERSEVAG